jgi:DNA-binding LacI/PurR family transcriptional regulator
LTAPKEMQYKVNMKPLRLTSIAEQVAAHLTEEIMLGTLVSEMPGAKKLAKSLGVNHKTVDTAADLLEDQGLLKSQGPGKPRLIICPKNMTIPSLRVAILIYEPEDADLPIITELRHRLTNDGHNCLLADKSQMELSWDVSRVARLVKKTNADAWIVQSSSREILDWFAGQPFPMLALHGQFVGLSIAASGVSMIQAAISAVDQLVALGHRSIVMIAQKTDLLPIPTKMPKVFLEQLKKHEIQTSSYNLPNWECSPEGLHKLLDALFQVTPPTAIFITDVVLFFPTYLHLLRRGIRIPEDVSLISTEVHSQFNWCVPSVSHFGWDRRKIIQRTLNWANNVANGKVDIEQKMVNAEFVANGTIGKTPSS